MADERSSSIVTESALKTLSIGNQISENLVTTSIKSLKGKPWDCFLKKPDDVPQSSTSNVLNPSIPKGEAKKQIVKIPSSWKLVPIKMNAILRNEPSRDNSSASVIPFGALNIDLSGMVDASLLITKILMVIFMKLSLC